MSLRKKVIITVISDLVTDQRVHRAALALHQNGYDVVLVGRALKKSLPLEERMYETKRFRLFIDNGPLFYMLYNVRLFFYLLFSKADFYLSNDLDTLLAGFLASKLKNVKLVYDSHEYFTEVPELIARPFVRSVWMHIEKWIFPKLKSVMTVNDSIAEIYTAKYTVQVKTVRNLPLLPDLSLAQEDKQKWNIPSNAKVFLFQGAGINIDRGAEEAVAAIEKVEGAVLLFIGSGDIIEQLKIKVKKSNMEQKVVFVPKQPFRELIRFTKMADFGLTLDKDTNLNYRFSLPNKIFDYIQAGLPILATDLPEVKKVIQQYNIGRIVSSSDPLILAQAMKEMTQENLDQWKKNLNLAAKELCWENEQHKLLELFENV